MQEGAKAIYSMFLTRDWPLSLRLCGASKSGKGMRKLVVTQGKAQVALFGGCQPGEARAGLYQAGILCDEQGSMLGFLYVLKIGSGEKPG